MPYIPIGDRVDIDFTTILLNPGELNYCITKAINNWIESEGGVSYDRINAAIGVLECAKLELYRRIAAPYEDTKCAENGDVYTL